MYSVQCTVQCTLPNRSVPCSLDYLKSKQNLTVVFLFHNLMGSTYQNSSLYLCNDRSHLQYLTGVFSPDHDVSVVKLYVRMTLSVQKGLWIKTNQLNTRIKKYI